MNKLTIIGIMCFLVGSVWSQQTFTLESAKAYALDNHSTVKNAILDLDIAHQKIVETRGMGLPQVDITGSFNHFLNLPVQVLDAQFFNPNAPAGSLVSFKAGTDYTASGTLQVGQLLFNGSYIVGLQASRFFEKFQQTATDVSKEDVVFNVIQAYQLVSVAKENLQFVDSMVILTQELIDKQQHYLDLGMIESEVIDQLSYSLLTAKDAKLEAQLQYQNAQNVLKFSMGYPMGQPIEISEQPEDLMRKQALSTGQSTSQNLTYQMLEKQVGLQKLNVKNMKFANLPTLNAFFQQTYNAYRNEFNLFADEQWFPQTLWGLQLNVPIFSGLSRHARTSQAKIELMKAENSLTQMGETLKFQEQQAKNNLISAQSKHDLQKENIVLARSIYNKSLTREKIGKENSIAVTQKYNQLMAAQAQYIGTLVNLFQSKLELDKIYNNILPNE